MPRKSKKVEDEPMVTEPEIADVCPEDAAKEPEPEQVDLMQVVTFMLEGQLYGLPIGVVQEIQQLVALAPVPDDAPALVGLIDVRGRVVPAIDLRLLLGLPARPFDLETPMIFCRAREHVISLIVDAVEDVVDLPADGLQPPSGLSSMGDRLLGMCRLPQGLLLVLDIDRLVPESTLAAGDLAGGAC